MADREDNAIFVFNADQRDSNGDGYGNVIDGDFNDDGRINIQDLAFMRGAIFKTDLEDGVDAAADADFDGDGSVGLSDLAAFRSLFGSDLGASYVDLIG